MEAAAGLGLEATAVLALEFYYIDTGPVFLSDTAERPGGGRSRRVSLYRHGEFY